jgi:hypothetical protein
MTAPNATPKNPVRRLLQQLAPLRQVLGLLSLLVIIYSPSPGTTAVTSGWEILPTLIVPVLAPIIFMVLILDTLMGWIFMIDKTGDERKRYKTVMVINVLLALALGIRWFPYFQALGG